MPIVSKTTVKSYFETGDKPTQAEFEDFIDTSIRDPLVAIASGAEGGKVGIVEILGTAESTSLAVGTFGRSFIQASAATTARALLSAGTVGDVLFLAETTASAQGHLGAGAVGIEVLEAITTASAQGHLALTVATQAEMETATADDRTVSPGRQHNHPGHPKVWVNFNGTGTVAIRSDYNVTSITDNGTGDYTVNFTTAFADSNYATIGMGQRNASNDGGGHTVVKQGGTYSTTAVQVATVVHDVFANEDAPIVNVACFGDQ
jgi:flagellar hook-associated protein FlgK